MRELDGVSIACAGVAWPILNAAFLASPVGEARDLAARIDSAHCYFSERSLGWIFAVCDPHVSAEARAEEAFAAAGLVREATLTGMAAGRIVPPAQGLPRLEYRRVGDETTRNHIGELNAVSYEMPLEIGREAAANPEFWRRNFAYVGYIHDRPVTCALVVPIENALYLAWVATEPGERKKGYAEAVVRHSLAEAGAATGAERTVLHATEEGYALYLRLGYHSVATFSVYLGGTAG